LAYGRLSLMDQSRQEISDLLAKAMEQLQRLEPADDWVDTYGDDGLLTSGAAIIAGVSPDTIARRCREAEEAGRPIGILIAGAVWLVSKRRLLDDIERRLGKHARLVAESRAEKLIGVPVLPQISTRSAVPTADVPSGERRDQA
jgi:hypothetical protein